MAWVLDQEDHVVTIPGTTKLAKLKTNLGALDCRLTEDDHAVLNKLALRCSGIDTDLRGYGPSNT